MNELYLFIIIWAVTGGLIAASLAKLYPHWETWKINTTLVLSGPLIWLSMIYYALFVEKRS